MQNPRIYVRCLHKILIEENMVFFLYKAIKRFFYSNYDLVTRPQKISQSLKNSEIQFQKAKSIIDKNANIQQTNFFNFVK